LNTRRAASKWFGSTLASQAGLALTLVLVSVPVGADAGRAQDTNQVQELAAARGIEGVWGVTVTLTNCDTGTPVAPPFRSLVTFAAGGTVNESTGGLGFAPEQRSEGHGVWRQTARRRFTQRTIALLRFETPPQPPAPGFLAGWQVIDHVVTLVDSRRLTSEGTTQFFDTTGQLYRSGCSTAVGERFK